MNRSQAGLLAYLKSCRANGQATPTLREIGAHFGVHQQTAHEWMKALVAAGKIERRFKTPRMVKIIADESDADAYERGKRDGRVEAYAEMYRMQSEQPFPSQVSRRSSAPASEALAGISPHDLPRRLGDGAAFSGP